MASHQPTDALLQVLQAPLGRGGLDLEAVEISTAGRRRVVRVLVDKDGGVTLDDLAAATSVVGASLDASEVLGDRPYTLEVTSPGTDRPLTAPRHWRRNVGRLVSVTLVDGAKNSGKVSGRIREAAETSVVVDVDGVATEIRYDAVAAARVEVEFNRTRSTEEV